MKRKLVGLAAAVVMACGVGVHAHHSQVATYNISAEQKIEGKLVQVMIRSPHSWVHVEATDDGGEVRRFAIEWGGATQLRNQGVDAQTLRIGDHVLVTGRPGRNSPAQMLMVYIERPSDGWNWGNRPGEVVD